MEDLPMVCYSTGTINSLLEKLAKMKNHSTATEEFSDLTQEFKKAVLSLKEDFLNKLAVPRVCMKQVRELVFEIEDWIDQRPETNMLYPRDTREIGNFMTEMKEARDRFTWYYHVHNIKPTEPDLAVIAPSDININPRLLIGDKSCHGLFDGPREELVKHLTDKEEMRKVVSVVGMEGLGKTTLAKEIYSELQLHRLFECRAFVSVCRTTPMTEILIDILRQVKPWRMLWEVQDVQEYCITELREYLGTKRYFIIVDGIWSTWAWKVINCVLPNNRGSRILTTTCIMDVGIYCSSYPNDLVYQMEKLNKENSRILFLSKIITLQEEEKWASFEEDSCYMMKICDGMPLAITVAAGLLLARKSKAPAELKMLGESILSSWKQFSTSEGMTKILHMSYADLCLPLRSCFLYLSVFPENYTIKKDHLIRLWEAEGFLPRIGKEYLFVTGERYFSELISRRLIQPVFNFNDDQAVGCTVHTVILDFIKSLSREENFATRATELNSGPFPCDTIRRFSLDCGNEDQASTLSTSSVHLSCMRSLIVFRDVKGTRAPPAIRVSMNILSVFKLLRVLDLEGRIKLEGIGGLVLLRHLGLRETGISRLPEDIGELQQLETIDWRRRIWPDQDLPASVVKLHKLKHLLLEVDSTEIWEMPELEAASEIVVQGSSPLCKVVELLRKSERLRLLGLTFRTSIPTETDLVSFFDEVVKSNLQSLSLYYNFDGYESITLLVDSWEKVTAQLGKKFEPRRFEIRLARKFHERVPRNMGALAGLTHLHVDFTYVGAEDFLVLGGLTNLVLLKLTSFYLRGRTIVKEGTFPSLKVFSFNVEQSGTGLQFEGGAMPQLRSLWRYACIQRHRQYLDTGMWQYLDTGMEHLTSLTRVHAIIICTGATVSEVEAAEAVIRGDVSVIPTKPTLELSRESEHSMREDEQDDDQIREDEGQHSILDSSGRRVSEKANKSTLERSIEDEDPMRKDTEKQVFENVQKRIQLGRSIPSLIEKIKDKLFGRPKVPENSNKHKLESSIEVEDQMRKDKGKHSVQEEENIPFIPFRPETHVTEEQST